MKTIEFVPVRLVRVSETGALVRAEDGRAAWIPRREFKDGKIDKWVFDDRADAKLSLVSVEVEKAGVGGMSVLVRAADGRKAWVPRGWLEKLGDGKALTQKTLDEKSAEFSTNLKKWQAEQEELRAQEAVLVVVGKTKTKAKLSESGNAFSLRTTYTRSDWNQHGELNIAGHIFEYNSKEIIYAPR